MIEINEHRKRAGIIAFAFAGQLLLVHRAFGGLAINLAMMAMMLIALLPSHLEMTSRWRHSRKRAGQRVWLVAVIIGILLGFLTSDETSGSIQRMVAWSFVFGVLIGQVIIVAAIGVGHGALLTMGAIATIVSLVCAPVSINLYRQVAESSLAIGLFAMVSTIVARDRAGDIESGSRRRGVITMVLLLVVVLVSRPLAAVADGWLPMLQLQLEGAMIQSDVAQSQRLSATSRYVDTASLNDVVDQFDRDPKAIAVRVFADQSPGYLRGRAFDTYHNGQWYRRQRIAADDSLANKTLRPKPDAAPLVLRGEVLRRRNAARDVKSAFVIDADAIGDTITMEIQNDPTRGLFFFLPLGATRVDGTGRRVVFDVHRIPISGLDTKETYFATVHQESSRTPLPMTAQELTLQMPKGLSERISELAERVCGIVTAPRAKAARLVDYFQREFRYSVDRRDIVADKDPIDHFLQSRHAAHCEYFASAAALMLRSEGVPARYVTGYVVDEFSDETDSWLGRNLNAHAWVEAYDDRSERWFIVEATPGRDPIELAFSATTNNRQRDQSAAAGNNDWLVGSSRWFYLLRTGQFSLLMIEISELARWPLTITTMGLLITLLLTRNRNLSKPTDDHSAQYRRLLRRTDRYVESWGLSRQKNESIHHFAARIESLPTINGTVKRCPLPFAKNWPLGCFAQKIPETFLHEVANWYRAWAAARYRSEPPQRVPTFEAGSTSPFSWNPFALSKHASQRPQATPPAPGS